MSRNRSLFGNGAGDDSQVNHGIKHHKSQHGQLTLEHLRPVRVKDHCSHVGQIDRHNVAPHNHRHREEPDESGAGKPNVYQVVGGPEQILALEMYASS